MTKQMRLNALDMNCVGACPGLWLHPEDETHRYNTLEYWLEMARLLERGLFDALFIADIYGIYDVYGGNADAAFRNAVEFPVNDPFLLVPAMATVTKHLSFGITGTVTYEAPYSFARRPLDARSPHQRPDRMEHRHGISRKRREGFRNPRSASAR